MSSKARSESRPEARTPGAVFDGGEGLRRRPRRLRRTAAIRSLVRETRLSPEMFIYPLFVCPGEGQRREVSSMPGVYQLSVDEAVREADQALALARAGDRGWERGVLEAAARKAFAARSPVEVRELLLMQVVDRPGTEEDQALFRVITDVGSEEILLVRQGDDWTTPGPL